MDRYPTSMMDSLNIFPTEEACVEFLRLVRWPEGYSCLRFSSKSYSRTERGLFQCRDCGYEGSVTRGTLFQDTHRPLRL